MQSDENIFADSIGIDLGTTQCCIAVYKNNENRPVVIPNSHGRSSTPSVISFMKNNGNDENIIEVIGEEARKCDHLPKNIVYEVKRLIGKRYNDASILRDKQLLPYEIIENQGAPKIEVFNREYAPEDISAKILAELKTYAESVTGRNINSAVVTVPAHFNNAQWESTRLAAQQAGFTDVRLMNEPTAAAVQHSRNMLEPKTVLVYDFGGGTFDVTLARANKKQVCVLAKDGDAHLGGADLDNVLMKYVAEKFRMEHGIDIMHGRNILRLKRACEEAKKALSHLTNAVILMEAVTEDLDIREEIAREQFENLCSQLFDLTIDCVKRTLQSAGMEAKDVDEVLIVGGSSNIPKIKTLLGDVFGEDKVKKTEHPGHAIALGAAIQAVKRIDLDPNLEDFSVTDVCPLSIGTEEYGGLFVPVISRGSNYPLEKQFEIVTCADNQQSITIDIYEGERKQAKLNNLLGTVILDGIPEAPAGEQSVQVTFIIDENRILKVRARNEFAQEVEQEIIPNMFANPQANVNNFEEIAERNRNDDERFVEWHRTLVEYYNHALNLRHGIRIETQESNEQAIKISLVEDYKDWILSIPDVGVVDIETRFDMLLENIENISLQD